MKQFKVRWEIDIEAETPASAALQALAYQRDPASWATVFEIVEIDGRECAPIEVDLEPILNAENEALIEPERA